MLNLARYIPARVININTICIRFSISEKINAASRVAVNGCINKPIEPFDAEILPIPNVIKNWPPNWHKNAIKNMLIHSKLDIGIIDLELIIIGTKENKQQKNVV